MIESLHIEDLGVIEEADLVLSPGLTALTGETGAGKTMVLTSLGLLLGQRAESTIVRAGAERALVEGVFALDGASPASRRAAGRDGGCGCAHDWVSPVTGWSVQRSASRRVAPSRLMPRPVRATT